MTPTWWSSFLCRMVLGEGGFSSSPTLRAENIKQSQYKFTFLKSVYLMIERLSQIILLIYFFH